MQRLYDYLTQYHIQNYRQMLFLVGPRQVGKTTIAKQLKTLGTKFVYTNWDNPDHKKIILNGPLCLIQEFKLDGITETKPIIVFDEIHKYKDWRNYLKGFFDTYNDNYHIVVTGSSKLDVYSKAGDSLMGRYFPYHVCPISVGEIVNPARNLKDVISLPKPILDNDFKTLWDFGGFPEPYLKGSKQFSKQWSNLRNRKLVYEDIQTLSHITDIASLELLTLLLEEQVGSLINRTELAKKIHCSVPTITRWLDILEAFYYCFKIKPWSNNITRSLIKEPKYYLWDWASIRDIGARAENFIASHLYKSVLYWSDLGLGDFDLFFIRDKDKQEVDFVITQDNKPWILIEVKYSTNNSVSKHLYTFQEKTKAEYAFQVVIDMPYINADCFAQHRPIKVPARTLLSQLI